jgi:predicted transcriptional regulator
MDNTTINNEILDIFKNLGISERESRILIVLNKNIEGLKQKDICIEGYMYQPEVSMGLKKLIAKDWISIIDRMPLEKKGRPFGIYALSKPFNQIIDEIETEITGKYELTLMDIERLKKIA